MKTHLVIALCFLSFGASAQWNFEERDLYERLHAHPNEDRDQLEKKYFQAMIAARHPDPVIQRKQQSRVREAWDELRAPTRRRVYDNARQYEEWVESSSRNPLPPSRVELSDPLAILGLKPPVEEEDIIRAFVLQKQRSSSPTVQRQLGQAFAILSYPPTRDEYFMRLRERRFNGKDPQFATAEEKQEDQRTRRSSEAVDWAHWNRVLPEHLKEALVNADTDDKVDEEGLRNSFPHQERLHDLERALETIKKVKELTSEERKLKREYGEQQQARTRQNIRTALTPLDIDISMGTAARPEDFQNLAQSRAHELYGELSGLDEKVRFLSSVIKGGQSHAQRFLLGAVPELFPESRELSESLKSSNLNDPKVRPALLSVLSNQIRKGLYQRGRQDLIGLLDEPSTNLKVSAAENPLPQPFRKGVRTAQCHFDQID